MIQKRTLLLAIAATALIGGACVYSLGGRYVSTDNAYLKAPKISISPEVAGKVTEVLVTDNTRVKQGDLLFRIDEQPFAIALRGAEADLAGVGSDIGGLQADYQQKKAELERAEENIRYQQQEYDRYRQLMATSAVAAAKVDEAKHLLTEATKARDSALQEMMAEEARLSGNPALPAQQQPRYLQAVSAVDKAQLDLTRTTVTAPSNGIVASVTLEPGEYVTPGQPLFSLVDDSHIWIEANFKETDLTYVRPGQKAEVEVDTYPGHHWNATVASITPATGVEFSLFPPQNSSGNWVKVVQRIMVRLEIDKQDKDFPLAAGMSTLVTIDTGKTRVARMLE